MGTRTLKVSAALLVEFLKDHDARARTYTIESPLPDDTRVVEVESLANWPASADEFRLRLASDSWHDDTFAEVTPTIRVHTVGEAAR